MSTNVQITPEEAQEATNRAADAWFANKTPENKAAWEAALDQEEAICGGFSYNGPFSSPIANR